MKNFAASLSTWVTAVALVAVIAFAVRSYRVGDVVIVTRNDMKDGGFEGKEYGVSTGGGRILVSWRGYRYAGMRPSERGDFLAKNPLGFQGKVLTQFPEDLRDAGWARSFWTRRGFVFARYESEQLSSYGADLAAPFWAVAAPLAIALAIGARRRVRARNRRRAGACERCGYDLRATPERCPECGLAGARGRESRGWQHIISATAAGLLLAAGIAVALCGRRPANDRAEARQSRTILTTSLPSSAPATRAVAKWAGLPVYQEARPIPEHVREVAARVDVSRPYIFWLSSSGGDPVSRQRACLQVFERRAGRWRVDIVYVKPGERIKNRNVNTRWTAREIRGSGGGDVVLTLVDDEGHLEQRTGEGDKNDPVRQFLSNIVGYGGIPWDKALFGQ